MQSIKGVNMTFYEWMMAKYLGKDTPGGDLAEDMKRVRDFPETNTREAILDYLGWKGACSGCVQTFKRCWRDYERVRNGKKVIPRKTTCSISRPSLRCQAQSGIHRGSKVLYVSAKWKGFYVFPSQPLKACFQRKGATPER